jgi:hypothetical protein
MEEYMVWYRGKLGIVLSLLMTCPLIALGGDSASRIPQHSYKTGETVRFLFENTDTRYGSTPGLAAVRAGGLQTVEEIKVNVKVEAIDLKDGVTKKVTLTDVVYRKQSADDIRAGKSANYSPAVDLVPNFPGEFTYTYHVAKNDGEVESSLAGFFKGFLNNSVATFLYYKMQDFHAFLGSVDTAALKRITVGQSVLSNELAIPLEHGTFHNAPMLTMYSTYATRDGIPQGDFQSMVMGNVYDMADPAPQIETNYQYFYTAAAAGKYAGLPLHGKMTETIYSTEKSSRAVTIIQRMVSVMLTR